MKTPFDLRLRLGLCLVLGALTSSAAGRGNDAEQAIKAAEARLRGNEAASTVKARTPAPPQATVPVQGNFFTKLAAAFARPGTAPANAPKSGASAGQVRELPATTVRAGQSPARQPSRSDGGDLGKLVSGILMRLGPMQLERSDDAVMNPGSDSLSLLSHPNIQPVIPVAPVPIPSMRRQEESRFAPNPLTEHRTSWLVAKVSEKLEKMEQGDVLVAKSSSPAAKISAPPAPEPDHESEREKIELVALLAVAGEGRRGSPPLPKRSETEARTSVVSLLASASVEGAQVEDANAPKGRPSALRELQRFPGQQLEPIPVIKPAQGIESDRNQVLMLLQPDSFVGTP